jgi:hypothetical protein
MWIMTDETQFCLKINDTTFKIIDVCGSDESGFRISKQTVDVLDEDEQDLLITINFFGYSSIEEMTIMYGKETNQVLAECIAETYWDLIDDLLFKTEDEAMTYIKQHLLEGISV